MASTPLREAENASQRVYRGIMRDLEEGRLVPGQILSETGLAGQYGVGRNAVREAVQHLAARGVVDLSRNRSPTIRRLDHAETLEILDVAGALTALAAQAAARRYDPVSHAALVAATLDALVQADADDEPGAFSRARRHFYRVLLRIGENRELQRLFPAISMHIITPSIKARDYAASGWPTTGRSWMPLPAAIWRRRRRPGATIPIMSGPPSNTSVL